MKPVYVVFNTETSGYPDIFYVTQDKELAEEIADSLNYHGEYGTEAIEVKDAILEVYRVGRERGESVGWQDGFYALDR